MQQEDVDDLLLGMSSQIAEREDSIVVEDLQGLHTPTLSWRVVRLCVGRDGKADPIPFTPDSAPCRAC
mgnify:FL=1